MMEAVQSAYPTLSVAGWLTRQCGRLVSFVASIKPIGWILLPILWPTSLLVCLLAWGVFTFQIRRCKRGVSEFTEIVREVTANTDWGDDDEDTVNRFGQRLTKQTVSLILYWDLRLDEYADSWVEPLAFVSEQGAFLYPQQAMLWRAAGEITRFQDALNELAEAYVALSKRWPVAGAGTHFAGCFETAEILADRTFNERLQQSIEQPESIPWAEARKSMGL